MRNPVNRIANYIFFKIITPEKILERINMLSTNNCKKNCTIDYKTRFYPEAVIENLSKNIEKINIGSNCHIRGKIKIFPYSSGLVIGNNCYIGENTQIISGDKITIGNNVLISHNVNIIDTNSHELNPMERSQSFIRLLKEGHAKEKGAVITKSIVIGNNVWINFNSVILKGVKIGDNCIIAPGSILLNDFPSNVLIAGNPAKIIKEL